MSEEGPVVHRGSYTWHPVYPYLLTLLNDLHGARLDRPNSGRSAGEANSLRYEKRLEAIAPKIIEMRANGRTREQIREELGIGNATLTKYIHDINDWGLGKC